MGESEFNRRLRTARRAAGYKGAPQAWAALSARYDATPSLSTFTRWESDPDAEWRADPGAIAVLCYDVYRIEPRELGSAVIVDRINQLRMALRAGKLTHGETGDTARYASEPVAA